MLKQLQKIYPSIIPFTKKNTVPFHQYVWYVTNKNDVFGIHEDELTKKDVQLLDTFFKRYNQFIPDKTVQEQTWYDRIKTAVADTPSLPYRFVYFSMTKDQIEPNSFKEAISELFSKTTPILWEDETSGIIVEEIAPTDEQINYEQIIDIFMADLSVHIKFYIGDIQQSFKNLSRYYASLIEIGSLLFQISNKEVINYVESVPYLLLHHLDEQTKDQLCTAIFKNFHEDDDMIKTLEMFLHSNLNVSETAKKMYMHRNSLQYRIDKFITETGINIQKFDDAVAVKLALLIKRMK